ncbi:MAG: GspMb/PilO family protein [Gemmatimonadota bacterium]
MTPGSRSPVGLVPAPATRERRVVIGGALIVLVALCFTYVVMPYVTDWRARETELAATHASIAELSALAGSADALDSAATAAEQRLAARGRRVFRARSTTLAASALQSYLQDASDASGLAVTRLDVAAGDMADTAVAATGAAQYVPASLSANCDIHGLASLLAQFANGPRVVQVTRMTVQMNSALRGAPDMLQVTLALRAPVVVE